MEAKAEMEKQENTNPLEIPDKIERMYHSRY
jgi:hypothetical protein